MLAGTIAPSNVGEAPTQSVISSAAYCPRSSARRSFRSVSFVVRPFSKLTSSVNTSSGSVTELKDLRIVLKKAKESIQVIEDIRMMEVAGWRTLTVKLEFEA